jgi:hypothetical protein
MVTVVGMTSENGMTRPGGFGSRAVPSKRA